MNGAPADWFTGSLINFYSYGYNRIGSIDFSQILVPCPEWLDLSRRHYPNPATRMLSQPPMCSILRTSRHARIVSEGTDIGEPTVLW